MFKKISSALFLLVMGVSMGGFQSSICCMTQSVQSCDATAFNCNRKPDIASHMKHLSEKDWLERYKAAMVLGGAGDAIGYKRGHWEFEKSGTKIMEEVKKLGGIQNIKASKPDWIVSDDTVMHLATAEAIMENENEKPKGFENFLLTFAKYYKVCMEDMDDRAPGITSMTYVEMLDPNKPDGYIVPFYDKGGGCGAAMRSMCIGLYYPREEQLDDLIALSIETGRMTHNNPTGYLGSLASALFVHLATQGHPVQSWGAKLVQTLDKAWKYVETQGRDVEKNKEHWSYFEKSWKNYLTLRGIEDGFSMPQFLDVYDVEERDKFYQSISFNGWGGSSGHDAPMIAYDALLGCGKNWAKLSERAFFHGGDSDSTAIIAATIYGVMYGFHGVPLGNYENLEYRDRLEKAGEDIFSFVKESFTHRNRDGSYET